MISQGIPPRVSLPTRKALVVFVMKKYLLLLLVGSALLTDCLGQSGKAIVGSPKSWIKKVAFDSAARPAEGQEGSYYYLLLDEQENFSEQEFYAHYVYKIQTGEGIQQMADLSLSFDPAYEQLIVHAVSIHRAGRSLNKLPNTIRTIQREESMDRHIYDGSLTSIINLTDVRVGDIVEYAYTLRGYNPVHKDHIDRRFYLDDTSAKLFHRIIVPDKLHVDVKHFNINVNPDIQKRNGQTVYTWERDNVTSPQSDDNTPGWYNPYEIGSVSSFTSWAEVNTWATTLFRVKESDKNFLKEAAKQQFKSSDAETYTRDVIRFVQDEIRYLGFETGLNTHQPYPPIRIYNQRFGDCKDKSLLLVTLLKARNIEAYPVLVSTTRRGTLADFLPSAYIFDHCVVQVSLTGKIFYVDPTINNQGGIPGESLYFPPYGKGLVIDGRSADFVSFGEIVPTSVHEKQTYTADSIGSGTRLIIHTTYTGREADVVRSDWESMASKQIQQNYKEFYAEQYPDIELAKNISFSDNRDNNVIVVEEVYHIPKLWLPNGQDSNIVSTTFRFLSLETYLNVSHFVKRRSPYRLSYPLDRTVSIDIDLPYDWNLKDDNINISNEYYAITYIRKNTIKHLSLMMHYQHKAPAVPADMYQAYVDDHKKMWNNTFYLVTNNTTNTSTMTAIRWPGILVAALALLGGVVLGVQRYRRSGYHTSIGRNG